MDDGGGGGGGFSNIGFVVIGNRWCAEREQKENQKKKQQKFVF